MTKTSTEQRAHTKKIIKWLEGLSNLGPNNSAVIEIKRLTARVDALERELEYDDAVAEKIQQLSTPS